MELRIVIGDDLLTFTIGIPADETYFAGVSKLVKNSCRGVMMLLITTLVSCQWMPGGGPGYEVNKPLYRKADAEQTSVKISLWDQKAWLLDGEGRVILKTDVSTGVPDHETPTGTFAVLEKLEHKRSNLYGKYVDAKSRKVVVEKNWLHEGPPPAGTVYEGTDMPYWLRLTWDGVGMHVGGFPLRTRASFGCIRVYKKAQPLIYQKAKIGTPVTIFQKSLAVDMAGKEDFGVRSKF